MTMTSPGVGRLEREAPRVFLTQIFPEAGLPMHVDGHQIVGRDPGRGFWAIDDGQISRRHFEVRVSGLAIRVRDLGSKNGTILDGRPLEGEGHAIDGAIIRAGGSIFTLSRVEAPFPGMDYRPEVGVSPGLTLARALVDRAATSEIPVLIEGESGAGKELLARRVHEASGRSGDFIDVNCASFPSELIASELFGHVRGAFSGAGQKRPGLFLAATGGTLFLDEIADLPRAQQPALLRVLQERRVRPVGAERATPIDARVVSATHDLKRAVEDGHFRGDLYARLAGLVVRLPGLRQRRADILPLFREFMGRRRLEITADAAEALVCYRWPYNVRELLQIAQLTQLFLPNDVLTVDKLPVELLRDVGFVSGDQLERDQLFALLVKHKGNVSRVAAALKLTRQQLYRRLEAQKVDPKLFRNADTQAT